MKWYRLFYLVMYVISFFSAVYEGHREDWFWVVVHAFMTLWWMVQYMDVRKDSCE